MRRLLLTSLAAVTAIAACLPGLSPVPAVAVPEADPPLGNLAPTPPMGWNSWNRFECNINEQLIRETADALVSSGMAAAGYKYVNIDDCWMASQRDGAGRLAADPARFPSGIKVLADYVHAKGLKLGIYSSAGSHTCQGRPASLYHEEVDARTWAEWGVDLLKYDNCGQQDGIPAKERYKRMGDALAKAGRPILYSICEWGQNQPWLWGAEVGGHLWRTTGDITDTWASVMDLLDQQVGLEAYSGPNKWNDPDMLEVGNPGLTRGESRAHMSLWSLLNAPLIAGNDLRSMDSWTRSALTDPDVLAVNQDWSGRQGAKLRDDGLTEVWSKKMSDGSVAVVLLNRSPETAVISTTAAALGLSGTSYTVKDLWSNTTRSSAGTVRAHVPSHDAAMFRITPGAAAGVPPLVTVEPVSPTPYVDGARPVDVQVRVHNDGTEAVSDARVTLTTPEGWEATPGGSAAIPSIAAGQTGTATWKLSADRPDPATVVLNASASWTWGQQVHGATGSGRFTVVKTPPAGKSFLSDQTWLYADNGWGPIERDQSVGEQAAGDGRPLTIGGAVHAKGLGMHSPGSVGFYLGSQCSRFTVAAGIDDEVGNNGQARFEVWGDGRRLAQAEATGAGGAVPLDVAVTGVTTLELRVDPMGENLYDHSDWGNPEVTCVGTPPPAGESVLSDRPWLYAENAWGPLERNQSVGGQGRNDGRPMTVAGKVYPNGLGGHANGKVGYHLGGKCSRLNLAVGIDDEVGDLGQVRFEVWGDGRRLAQAEATGAGGAVPLDVAVTGVTTLELRLDTAGSPDYDHADWLNPQLTCA
ncbi:NPCBM/NEW2 domain-containing protein [Kribbella deserti]|uniref:Alpha-galactosidase n=1 Tax=Kribbella deserti TaxID=1926257 RepID=A0ABV6QJT1_9ACTN